MNDPQNQPIDIEDQRAWLIDHKNATKMSWTELAKRIGRSAGTLSQFGSTNGYAGDEQTIAEQVYRYQQQLFSQAAFEVTAPPLPGFFAGPTANDIITILTYAQRGRMTVIATGAGMGKTKTIEHYQASISNVWKATMRPSSAGIMNMQLSVLAALGKSDAVGTPAKLSTMIMEKVDRSGGLLVLDEAQHLSEKSLEEIRSWHDETGVGIALSGNISVLSRLEGGTRKANFAQLFSRVGMRIVRAQPLQGDADALCDAWNIGDDGILQAIREISQKPGALRGATMTLELAHMIAASEGQAVNAGHVRDCWAQLSTRQIAA
ncbi:AAA family ATPase [Sphingopyxis sp. GW247-27LB]|uniref:AAA family ATPase n=1 Tax=Sphingopyxis sp. GW247-27LB TaxID=2012632 RepID=UPI0015961F67|nr:AAA family ATPase [Sphingopyxis sp. GW247-27LB]